MTALSTPLVPKFAGLGSNVKRYPANSVTTVEGSVIGFRPSTGYAVLWSGTDGDILLGHAVAGLASQTEISVSNAWLGRILCGASDETGFAIAGLTGQTQCPAPIYLSSDNLTADLTLTPTGPAIGRVVKYVSTGYGWIELQETPKTSVGFDFSNIGTVAAAGSAQGSATAITADITTVTAADGTKGVVLPLAAAGARKIVYNANATYALKVYPNTSDKINDASANASISLAPLCVATFIAIDAITWVYDEKVDLRNAQTIVGIKAFTNRIVEASTVSAKTTVVTLTIAELLTGIITATHAAGADQAYTLPLGTDCEAARTWATNEAFEWSLVNLSGTPATNTVTITANTGHTIVGPGVVVGSATAALNTRRCLTRRSAANTFITYVF